MGSLAGLNSHGWGKHSLRCGKTIASSRIPRPVTRLKGILRPLNTQAPVRVVEALRMEWGPMGCVYPGSRRVRRKEDLLLVPPGESLACCSWLRGHCGWEYGEDFYLRLDSGSIGKDLLHGSLQWILMERDSLCFQTFIVMVENHSPLLRSENKYLCREKCLGMEPYWQCPPDL